MPFTSAAVISGHFLQPGDSLLHVRMRREEIAEKASGKGVHNEHVRSGLVTLQDIRHQQTFLKDVQKRLERLIEKNARPEAVNKMIPTLLSHFKFNQDKEDLYTKRLQSGLYEYLLRRNQPSPEEEETEINDNMDSTFPA